MAYERISNETDRDARMTPGTRYPHAPITEAVIDIQVTATVSVDELAKAIADEPGYLPPEKLLTGSGAMVFGPEEKAFATAKAEQVGYLSRSADGLHIYQVRTNGFTFSRLAEYTSWMEISVEARRLWAKYRSIANPTRITRIALRYINRLDIPLPVQDFSFYLRTAPQLSSDLPQGLSGYFMQLQLPMPELQGTCIINQTIIEPPVKPGTAAVVLDIDVFRATEVTTDESQLWAQLGQLRDSKNRVFEACITDEARRLFK